MSGFFVESSFLPMVGNGTGDVNGKDEKEQ